MNRSHYPLALLLIPLALVCFAVAPQARATCQEGCLTNENTVLGDDALLNNSGLANTAIGSHALEFNTFGTGNTATGDGALFSNTGSQNTANGESALVENTTGGNNTATGVNALAQNTTGSENTATGWRALGDATGDKNTAMGVFALVINIGNNNIGLGYYAGSNLTTGRNNIDIGNEGRAGESSTIRIGTTGNQTKTFIAGISGATVPTGVAVIVDSSGHLGTTTSSTRYKDNIQPMDKASEAILALKPVTFRYKKDLDPEGIPQFGLVAEDVEKVNPDLVARDEQGKPYTVRYEAVNAMLLNEFLKAHRKMEKQKATIAKLNQDFQSRLAEQQKQIEALTAGLQKVSAELELSKAAPQIFAANQ